MPTRFRAMPAAIAALSLAATPAAAGEVSVITRVPTEQRVSSYGPYHGGGWGWGGGHRHRRGTTAGDILAGVLILGTIAAVASAASKAKQRRSYPDRYPYPDRQGDWRTSGPQGLDGAADLCLREIERDARVREVSRVERSAGGWLVTGAMADGAPFSCSIGADGRIDRIDIAGRARTLGTDRQYGDERYRAARAEIDGETSGGGQPAYPGGPLPGESPLDAAPQSNPGS